MAPPSGMRIRRDWILRWTCWALGFTSSFDWHHQPEHWILDSGCFFNLHFIWFHSVGEREVWILKRKMAKGPGEGWILFWTTRRCKKNHCWWIPTEETHTAVRFVEAQLFGDDLVAAFLFLVASKKRFSHEWPASRWWNQWRKRQRRRRLADPTTFVTANLPRHREDSSKSETVLWRLGEYQLIHNESSSNINQRTMHQHPIS
jgi:hypothetical protein